MHGLPIGEVAVSVFFAVSGYLVAQSWSTDSNFFRFMARRLLRICPALYLLLLLSVFCAGPLLSTLTFNEYYLSPVTWSYLKGFGLFWTQGQLPGVFESSFYPLAFNGPLWTIRIEAACYIILAFAGLLGFFRSSVSSLVLAVWFVFLLVLVSLDPDRYRTLSFLYMDAVSFFKLSAVFFVSSSFFYFRKQIPRLPGVAITMVGALFFSSGSSWFWLEFSLFIPYIVICLGFIPTKRLSKFGKHGDYSYGIYLYAWPTQQAVMQYWGNKLSFLSYVLVSASITILFAFVSWQLLEKFAINAKPRKRFAQVPAPPLSVS